jgi:hypothetical protein
VARPAAADHASIAAFAQLGTGMLRTRPCLPRRSTITQRPSRCRMSSNSSRATSVAAQAAADHHGQHGAVALALQRLGIGAMDERLGMALGEPVSGAGALDLGPAHVADALRRDGIEQAVIGGFSSQLAQGGQALVDGSGRERTRLQMDALLLHRGADKRRPASSHQSKNSSMA